MDTKIQSAKREAAIRKIIAAMRDGRKLSLFNDAEFKVSEMHTCFCNIRRKIRDGKITGVVMRDEWQTTADGIRYKVYWFEDAED